MAAIRIRAQWGFAAERPEAWAYGASAVCWAALLLASAAPGLPSLCVAGSELFAGLSFSFRSALVDFPWPSALWHWLVMIGAMMLPMTAPALRTVAFRSFRQRRGAAIGLFLLGYVAVWLAVAPLYLAAALAMQAASGGALLLPLAAAFAAAAAWQGTGAKQRALRLCHRTLPLPPTGWRADRACLHYGMVHGRYCLGSCWALMLIPAAAGHQLAPMIVASAAAIGERMGPAGRPERIGAPLAAAGLLCLALWVA